MTFVGKVLVVVQLALSVCFMAFAGAVFTVQSNWKKEAEGLQTKLNESKELVTSLEGEKQKILKDMNFELTKLDADRNKWKADATALNDKLQAKTDSLDKVETERDNKQALAEVANVEANMRTVEAELQRDRNTELHKKLDELGQQVRTLKDTIFSEKLKSEALLAKHSKILDELAARRKIMQLHNIEMPTDLRSLDGKTPPPPIVDSLVTDVRKGRTRGTEFVEVQIGSDDGLLEGHTLYVFRTADRNNGRAKFLGKIEIVLLTSDRAVGTVIEKAKNGVIQVGDHVTTRL